MMDLQSVTEQEFLKAISLAKSRQDEAGAASVRALYRVWMSEKDKAENDPLAGMSTGGKAVANFVAGIDTVLQGGKQLVSMASREDILEKEARDKRLADSMTGGGFLQGAGTAAALAPMALVPGANSVAGAAALGGASGALMPTTNENVVAGKALNTGLGAAGGAVMQKAANMVVDVAPRAYNAALDWYAKHGLPGASPQRQLRIGERAFANALPDQEQARLALMHFQEQVPGVRTSTAAALGDRPLLAAERAARETTGTPARVLGDQAVANNAARWNYIKGIGGDVKDARVAASEWFAEQSAKLKPMKAIDPNGKMIAQLDMLIDRYGQTSKAAAAGLGDIREGLANAMRANNGRGDIGLMHDVRMFAIDDKLNAIANSDAKVAGALRKIIGGPDGIKSQLDDELNSVTRGRWGKLMQGYSERIRIADQREAANELVQQMSTRNTSITGEPLVTSSMNRLRTAAQGPMDDFGKPVYGAGDLSRIQAVTQDAERQLSPYKMGVGPSGSATAANLTERGPADLMQYMRGSQPMQGGNVAGAAMGAAIEGGPKGAILGVLANQARLFAGTRNEQAREVIAGRIAELLADQQQAYQLLESLNSALKQRVVEQWAKRMLSNSPSVLGGAGATLAAPAVQSISQ